MNEKDVTQELPNLLLKSVQNIIHGNHVEGQELKLLKSNVFSLGLTVTVNWEFSVEWHDQKVAGGRAADIHYGYKVADFDQEHIKNKTDALNNWQRRLNFIETFNQKGVNGFIESDEKKTVYKYSCFSFHYDCSNCNGRQQVQCSPCSGTGRSGCSACFGSGLRTEYYDYNAGTHTESRSRKVHCSYCSGYGKVRCGNCNGNGRVNCNPCNGHGFFTCYRDMSVVAVPKVYFYVKCEKYHAEFLEYLLTLTYKTVAHNIYFSTFSSEKSSKDSYHYIYDGNSFLTEIDTVLRSQNHHILAYSNPPIAFKRPAIFDQLFIEEITALENITSTTSEMKKGDARSFFNTFAGQPVLDQALKDIAEARTSSGEDHSDLVIAACSSYISRDSATRLANSISVILDKVSPAYHGISWLIISAIFFIYAAILLEYKIEMLSKESFLSYLWEGFTFTFTTLLLFTIYASIAYGVSLIVTTFISRNIPKAYRQKTRNDEPFTIAAYLGFFILTLSSLYGYLALKDWAPKIEHRGVAQVYKAVNYLAPTNSLQKVCTIWHKKISEESVPHICGSRYFAHYKLEIHQYHIYGEVYLIQRAITEDQPDFKVDGKMGKETRREILKWFEKRGINMPEDAEVSHMAVRVSFWNRPY